MKISELNISQSENNYYWSAILKTRDSNSYVNANINDPIEIEIHGEIYKFIVVAKQKTRSGTNEISMQLSLSSPSVILDEPRSPLQDYEFSDTIYIKDAVEAILEQSVQWETVNWQILPYRISFNQVSPIEAVKTLVDSVKAIVTTNKDGTIKIRPIEPINTHEYFNYPVDHTIEDNTDILEISEEYQFKEGYNKFRIIESTDVFNDSIEWVEDEEIVGRGIIRAYPSPWRTNVALRTTEENSDISIYYDGITEREEIQEIEITNGTGSLSNPINSIVSIEWLSKPLGGISFTIGGQSISFNTDINSGYGLLKITYIVKTLDFNVTGVITDINHQFVLEEV